MKIIITLILGFLSLSSFAQTEIKLDDIRNHAGDSIKLMAKIYSGKYLENAENTPMFLDVGGKYPYEKLTLVIFGNVRKQFKNAPETFYEGRQEWIKGKIELYKNKPQIIIYSPDQIYDIVAAPNGK